MISTIQVCRDDVEQASVGMYVIAWLAGMSCTRTHARTGRESERRPEVHVHVWAICSMAVGLWL